MTILILRLRRRTKIHYIDASVSRRVRQLVSACSPSRHVRSGMDAAP